MEENKGEERGRRTTVKEQSPDTEIQGLERKKERYKTDDGECESSCLLRGSIP